MSSRSESIDRPRVLVVSNTSVLGGAERVLLRFLEHQDIAQMLLVAPAGPLTDAAAAAGVEVHVSRYLGQLGRESNPLWPLEMIYRALGSHFELAGLIRSFRAEIIQANSFGTFPYVVGPGLYRRLPIVWHLHDFRELGMQRRANQLFGKLCTAVVAVSDVVAEHLRLQGTDPARIRSIPNHVFETDAPLGDGSVAQKIESLKAGGQRVVGLMGTIDELKGFREAIQALALARDSSIRMVIAGAPQSPSQERYQQELEALAQREGLGERVHFLGQVAAAGEFFRSVDQFLHYPCGNDAFPTVLLEAVAIGVPVLAADKGGNAQILGHGRWGQLVPANEPETLAAALAQDPVPVSANERDAFLEEFSLQRKSREFRALYDQLLGTR